MNKHTITYLIVFFLCSSFIKAQGVLESMLPTQHIYNYGLGGYYHNAFFRANIKQKNVRYSIITKEDSIKK